jgi:hypothetical protein
MTTHTTPQAAPRAVTSTERSSAKRSRAPYRQSAFGGTFGGRTTPTAGSEARRLAAVILEVLAGVQTPASAAQVLGIRLPRYYLLEQRALGGLVSACEPRPKGRGVNSDRQIARLERELAVCRRELGRQQALARAAQRVLGLKAAAVSGGAGGNIKPAGGKAGAGTTGKRPRQRKPVVRALRAVRVLRPDSTTHPSAGEVQIPAGDAVLADGGNCPASGEAASLETQGEQGG